jgi:hypothetical protein
MGQDFHLLFQNWQSLHLTGISTPLAISLLTTVWTNPQCGWLQYATHLSVAIDSHTISISFSRIPILLPFKDANY